MNNQATSTNLAKVICLRNVIIPFCFYLFTILFFETLCRIVSGGFLPSAYSLAFILSESLLLTLLSGLFKRNGILTGIWLFLLTLFYGAQIVYYSQFGSFIPLSIIGMGTRAATGFRDELLNTISGHGITVVACLIPLTLYLLFCLLSRKHFRLEKYSLRGHICILTLTVIFWCLGIAVLPLGGIGSGSAYEAYHSSQVNTDLSVSRLGALTTSDLELGYMTGILPETDATDTLISQTVSNPFAETTPDSGTANNLQDKNSNVSGMEEDSDENMPKESSDDTIMEEGPAATAEPVIDTSPNILSAIDFSKLYDVADTYCQKLCSYFAAQSGTNKNEYTGLLEGYNLIYICGESFDTAAIDPELTPTLYKLSHSGIVLNNYYNSFKNITTNGEYAFMTGMWPDLYRSGGSGDTDGTFYATCHNYMPYGLGNIFNNLGVESFAYHGYIGSYYGRDETHPNLGYQCKFSNTGLKFSTTVPSSDYELIEQTVDDYINLNRFNVYYMTFSGHGNYNTYNPVDAMNYDYVSEVLSDKGYSEGPLCYLSGNYELEKGLTYLIDRLDEAGKLDNTLIVLAGDHYPYCLNTAQYRELMGDDIDFTFGSYKSTCIMWSASITEPIVSDTYCCNVDILPTVLNLLGIEYDSRMLSGTDIFSDSDHIAVLYNKNFITDKVRYNAESQIATWTIDTDDIPQEQLDQYLDYIKGIIDKKFTVANQIVSMDFFKFVWKNSGLANFDS